MGYVGRFAPSPTGPLHFGSLVTAVASFLHARQAGGRWLVRIEDIDPPREVPGAAAAILRALEAFALEWDGEVRYQSRHIRRYLEAAAALVRSGDAFECSCTRSELRAEGEGAGSRYPGTCRTKRSHERQTAIRARVEDGPATCFVDGLQGPVATALAETTGDYVIVRRDGLPAYHLAVVVDDAEQRVTTVVRGVDLLDSTAVHLHLQSLLGLPHPHYFHLPVVVDEHGRKLSKQTGAKPIETREAGRVAARALELLGASVPAELDGASPATLWSWALDQWRVTALRGRRDVYAEI